MKGRPMSGGDDGRDESLPFPPRFGPASLYLAVCCSDVPKGVRLAATIKMLLEALETMMRERGGKEGRMMRDERERR